MFTLRFSLCLAVLLLLCGGPALAQQATPSLQVAPQTGSGYVVTGRVICADTQRPARFAQVTLLSASGGEGEFDRGSRASARTDLDGRFTIENVSPGDYFATANLAGYIDDSSIVQNALSTGGTALDAIAAVPRVQVTAGGGTVQLSLQHGAVLAGTVQWDDGSPAAGVSVSVVPAPASPVTTGATPQSAPSATRFTGGQTDDRGRFRLSSLAGGAYLLRANLQSPIPGAASPGPRAFRVLTLHVYAPGKQRQTEATVYTVTAGEERNDIAIVLNLNNMHSVAGQVSSPSTGVHSGSVQLTDQIDSSLTRRSNIATDGSFSIPYVPPGTYSLSVTASSLAPGAGRGETSIRFQPFQESVTVTDGDLSGISVNVTPAPGTP